MSKFITYALLAMFGVGLTGALTGCTTDHDDDRDTSYKRTETVHPNGDRTLTKTEVHRDNNP